MAIRSIISDYIGRNIMAKKLVINIPTPRVQEVENYLTEWKNRDKQKYKLQEDSLGLLFNKFPLNNNLEEILFKAAALNEFYSTNIFSIIDVGKHILKLNIDKNLNEGDLSIVKKIAQVSINGTNRNFYSFATKYCAHHKPEKYPIYDDYVANVLVYFNKLDKFYEFTKKDLKDYEKFYSVIIEFREHYNLANYSIRDIDKYLWQLGKEYFPKNYGKNKNKVQDK